MDDCSCNNPYMCQISAYFLACATEKNKKKAIISIADKPFRSLRVGEFQM